MSLLRLVNLEKTIRDEINADERLKMSCPFCYKTCGWAFELRKDGFYTLSCKNCGATISEGIL